MEISRPKLARGLCLYRVPGGGYVTRPHTLQYFPVNGSACRVLALCDGTRSPHEIAAETAAAYQVTMEEEKHTIYRFLSQAASLGHVVESSSYEGAPQIYGDGSSWIPLVLSFELTMRCPLRCSHCYVSAGLPLPRELGLRRWLELLDQAAEMGVLRAYLTGGEPLVFRNIDAVLERAASQFQLVELASSGVGLRNHTIQVLAGSGNCSVQISLDGPAEVHNVIRGTSSAFQAAISAIECLSAAGVPIRVAMTVRPDTVKYVLLTASIARAHGARMFRTGLTLPQGRADWSLVLSEDGIAAMKQELAEAAATLNTPDFEVTMHIENLECAFQGDELDQQQVNCGAGWLQANIQSDGRVTPCLVWRRTIGNVRSGRLSQVFSSELARALRSLRMPGGTVCTGCPAAAICGRCPAMGLRQPASCAWREQNSGPLHILEPEHALG